MGDAPRYTASSACSRRARRSSRNARSARRTTPPATPACSAATSTRLPAKFRWRITACSFLDELPEFKRSVLETMRQPLEEGRVTISRAAGTMTFPSQFMLVAAMNPTPDGKMPGESRCSPREIQNYLNRISGPLLDRIDIHVEVPAVKFREITVERTGETPRKSVNAWLPPGAASRNGLPANAASLAKPGWAPGS
jgi:MoxR-like ATPase